LANSWPILNKSFQRCYRTDRHWEKSEENLGENNVYFTCANNKYKLLNFVWLILKYLQEENIELYLRQIVLPSLTVPRYDKDLFLLVILIEKVGTNLAGKHFPEKSHHHKKFLKFTQAQYKAHNFCLEICFF